MDVSRPLLRPRGFTLLELLVALAVMALVALLSWRGLDSMVRVQSGLRERAEGLASLQTGLTQWTADLDAVFETSQVAALDYDGRLLRLTRRDTSAADSPLRVVGWTTREIQTPLGRRKSWIRWQSEPLRTQAQWQQAWAQAQRWPQLPDQAGQSGQVAIVELEQWQLFYHRGGAWSHPLSAAGAAPATGVSRAAPSLALPDGIRLVLTLPPGQPLAGILLKDWARPVAGGSKS